MRVRAIGDAGGKDQDAVFFRQVFFPGEMVFEEGEDGHFAYLVESGSLAVEKRVEGIVQRVRVLTKGDLFGEMALITHEPRMASVVALETATVKVIKPEAIERQLAGANRFLKLLVPMLIAKVRDLTATHRETPTSLDEAHAGIARQLRWLRTLVSAEKRRDFDRDVERWLKEFARIAAEYGRK